MLFAFTEKLKKLPPFYTKSGNLFYISSVLHTICQLYRKTHDYFIPLQEPTKKSKMIHGHGDDGYLYSTEIRTNFSSNVYDNPQLEPLFRYLNTRWQSVCSYPEPQPQTAERALAYDMMIRPEEICLTNGATDAIYLIARTFRERHSCIAVPTFSEYADACRMHHHRVTNIYDLTHIPKNTDIVWICNPNNPTGEVIPQKQIKDLLTQYADVLFVIDQSYEDFTEETVFTAKEGIRYPNLILLHSITKRYGLPGLRIGYLTACETLTRQLRLMQIPWAVNQMAIESILYLSEHKNDFTFDLQTILKERARVSERLQQKGIATVWQSQTHFLLAQLRMGNASALKAYLVQEHGMLIRDASNFDGLDKRCFRIAVQSAEENDQLIDAIEEWIQL